MKAKRGSIIFVVFLLVFVLPGCGRKKEEWSGQDRKADNESKTEGRDSTREEEPEELSMTITFVNHAGEDIYALQASPADTDDWEEDILDVDVLELGDWVGVDFTFYGDQLVWDFAITNAEGDMLEFYDLDFGDFIADGATIVLNEDGTADIYDGADAYETLESEMDSEELYEPILSQYYELLGNGASYEEFQELTGSDLVVSYSQDLNLDSVGYAFFDIDENGTDELFIGCVQGGALTLEGEVTYGVFMNAYAVNQENQFEMLACSGRSAYGFLCTNGSIGRYEESIPFSESYEFFSLGEDGLYSEGKLVNDIENGGGWYAESDGSRSHLTINDEGTLRDMYTPMQIMFTPFSQLY